MGVPPSSRTWTLAVTMSPSRAATAVGVIRPREVEAAPARGRVCVVVSGVSEQTGLDRVEVVWRQKALLPGQPRTFSSPRDDSSGPAGADATDAKEGRGDAGQRQRQQQGHRAHSSLDDLESAGVAARAPACPMGRFKSPPCLFGVMIRGSISVNFDRIRCWERHGCILGAETRTCTSTRLQQQRLSSPRIFNRSP